ncbi:8256_t:CDS:2 [Paraglomus brasilianum]|uniref:8256_t:CDS:1 n=1 Tax=Paraglomus brasilianum TaxID=144538 RepID=A0A9N8Z2Y7_9GLOM|nr:8256_t:CDS:2 [Paraglomus brasilianum]
MDLDWCLICETKTQQGSLYCSEECRFKDYLSAYNYMTPPASPTSTVVPTIDMITSSNETPHDYLRKQSSMSLRSSEKGQPDAPSPLNSPVTMSEMRSASYSPKSTKTLSGTHNTGQPV